VRLEATAGCPVLGDLSRMGPDVSCLFWQSGGAATRSTFSHKQGLGGAPDGTGDDCDGRAARQLKKRSGRQSDD